MVGVPEISDERLIELYARIKPVIRFDHKTGTFPVLIGWSFSDLVPDKEKGLLYFIKDVHPRNTSFTWHPEPNQRAHNIEQFDAIITWHKHGFHGFFRPSVAEVLAQIPEKYLQRTVAFQTLVNFNSDNVVGEYYPAITILYEKK